MKNKKFNRTISNSIFIFENQSDLIDFWNNHIVKPGKSEVVGNTFVVARVRWIAKVLRWLLTK